MRIRPDHMGMNEAGSMSGAAVSGRALERSIARNRVSSVHFFEMKVGKVLHQARNAAARGLYFDGDRDSIAVIFNNEDERQLVDGGIVQRFPEFPLAGCAVSQGNVGDFVGVKLDVFELPVIALMFLRCVGVTCQIAPDTRAANCLENLRARWR